LRRNGREEGRRGGGTGGSDGAHSRQALVEWEASRRGDTGVRRRVQHGGGGERLELGEALTSGAGLAVRERGGRRDGPAQHTGTEAGCAENKERRERGRKREVWAGSRKKKEKRREKESWAGLQRERGGKRKVFLQSTSII